MDDVFGSPIIEYLLVGWSKKVPRCQAFGEVRARDLECLKVGPGGVWGGTSPVPASFSTNHKPVVFHEHQRSQQLFVSKQLKSSRDVCPRANRAGRRVRHDVRLNWSALTSCRVTNIRPDDAADSPFLYTFKVQCTSCREIHPKDVSISRFVCIIMSTFGRVL